MTGGSIQLMTVFAKVRLNKPLTTDDNNAWRSASGEFAFGFRQLNNDTKLFMVAIWYNMMPGDQTVVWSAKTGYKLATAPTGSRIQITSEGLELTGPKGDSIWIANSKDFVSEGAMLDSGNFVLLNGNSEHVWQSFDYPTDTLLPNQSLQLGGVLTSRLADTNFTTGRFQLYFHKGDSHVLLCPLGWPSQLRYESYHTIDDSGNASQLVFDKSGDIYVETTNGTRIQPQVSTWGNSNLDLDRNYYRATLDFTGVFTQYAYPRNSTIAQPGWKIIRRSVMTMEAGEEEKAILTDWAYDCCVEGKLHDLVENDKEALSDIGRLEKWIKIAIWCIQEHPEMRPTMGKVNQMVEGLVEVPNPPSPNPDV
ncbi:hypothetical protein JHK85_030606 [Glycine max]|nr:hypothetical protein JHK85_030606 [Glycine max]